MEQTKQIKLKSMAEKNKAKWISYDVSKEQYKVYCTKNRKLVHVAYIKDEGEAKLLAGLIDSIMTFHNLNDVACLRTYILKKYDNIKAIQAEAHIEQEKKKYKKKRKYLSNKDIYGSDEGSLSGDEFEYGTNFKESWKNLDISHLEDDETLED